MEVSDGNSRMKSLTAAAFDDLFYNVTRKQYLSSKKKIKNILNMRQMSQLKNCVENYIIP